MKIFIVVPSWQWSSKAKFFTKIEDGTIFSTSDLSEATLFDSVERAQLMVELLEAMLPSQQIFIGVKKMQQNP